MDTGKMTYKEFTLRVLTIVGIGLACVLFWRLRSIFMMGFLSSIIAVSLTIPVNSLQRRGLKRGQAIATTLVEL